MRFFFGTKAKPTPLAASPLPPPPRPRVTTPPPPVTATSTPVPRVKIMESQAPAPEPLERPLPDAPAAPPASDTASAPTANEKTRDISLYKALLSGLYDGVLIFNAKGFVIASNQRINQFLGYTESELWNMSCDQLIVAITPRILAKIIAYVESGRFTVVNTDCRRKDGTVFPAEIAISRIHFLQDGDFIFSIRNLDRREKARVRHELESNALRHACSGIAVCNLEGQIEYANPAFASLLNAQEEKDVVRRSIGEFCVSPETALVLTRATITQGFWFGRLDLRMQDGMARAVIATGGICPAKNDSPAHIVLTLTALPKTIV